MTEKNHGRVRGMTFLFIFIIALRIWQLVPRNRRVILGPYDCGVRDKDVRDMVTCQHVKKI